MGGFCWLRTCRRGSTSRRVSGTLQRIRSNVCNGRCGSNAHPCAPFRRRSTSTLLCPEGSDLLGPPLPSRSSGTPPPNPYTGGNPAQTYVIMPPQAEFLPRPYGEQGLVSQKIPLQNSGRSPQIPMEGRACGDTGQFTCRTPGHDSWKPRL